MSNKTKCQDCVHFQQKFKFENGKRRLLWYGWCGVKSTYPATMPPGHDLPPGATQVAPGETHAPVIVGREEVVPNCLQILRKQG